MSIYIELKLVHEICHTGCHRLIKPGKLIVLKENEKAIRSGKGKSMSDNMEIEINLVELTNALKRKLIWIIFTVLVGAGVGFALAAVVITPQYEASINMIVNTRSDNMTTVTNDNITSAKNLVSTYAIIIKSNIVLNKVINNLGLTVSNAELADEVSISAINATQVMKISVRDKDAELAGKIVTQIAEIAPDIIVEAVEAGSCKVISEVEVGDRPVSPKKTRYTALFAFLGLIVSSGIVIGREILSNYIVDDVDVEKKIGLPVLGVIPQVEESR